MKRFALFTLLFVLAVSLLGVCQMTPITDPTPVLNSLAGTWSTGICVPRQDGPFFNTVQFTFDTAAKTASITKNGYPGTKGYNDYTKDPFVYSFAEANTFEGDAEITYTFTTTLPEDTAGLGNKDDKLTTTLGVVPLNTNRFMAMYFRRNDTQNRELFQGVIFGYRSSNYTDAGLSGFVTEGRDLCDSINSLSTTEQGQTIRRWAK
jgi:hypothetical protein